MGGWLDSRVVEDGVEVEGGEFAEEVDMLWRRGREEHDDMRIRGGEMAW